MRLARILEANRQSVILVDFQPAYSSGQGYDQALGSVCEYINRSPNVRVAAFFNGDMEGLTEDNQQAVEWHYMEHGGLEEERIDDIQFYEKTYAFLRNWMDQGVDNSTIIKTLRFMVNNRINDSRDIEDEDLEKLAGGEGELQVMEGDMIYLPDISLSMLKGASGSLIGGGGRHECLAELQILMNAFNIKYKMVQDWIYG